MGRSLSAGYVMSVEEDDPTKLLLVLTFEEVDALQDTVAQGIADCLIRGGRVDGTLQPKALARYLLLIEVGRRLGMQL